MTDHDINVAGQIGELRADMRTVKHDVANLSGKMDALSAQISAVNTQQQRGLGFFAGAAFILVSAGGILLTFARMIFGATQ